MLPEHVKLLRDWVKEDTFEKEVMIDEQAMEEMNAIVGEAMEQGSYVAITHYRNHRYELLVAKIHHWDHLTERFHVVDRFDEIHYIERKNVVGINWI